MLNTRIRARGLCDLIRRISGKPAEPLALHREIDDDHIRLVAAVHPVSGRDVTGIENRIDARVFENAPAALVYDRMVVDDQNTGHGAIPPSRG